MSFTPRGRGTERLTQLQKRLKILWPSWTCSMAKTMSLKMALRRVVETVLMLQLVEAVVLQLLHWVLREPALKMMACKQD